MVKKRYIPERGDLVYLDFSPSHGHEQKGTRPAVIVSKTSYNRASGLALVIPVTSKEKGYPFEVTVRTGAIEGVALVDQIRSVDYIIRKVRFIGKVGVNEWEEIQAKLLALVG